MHQNRVTARGRGAQSGRVRAMPGRLHAGNMPQYTKYHRHGRGMVSYPRRPPFRTFLSGLAMINWAPPLMPYIYDNYFLDDPLYMTPELRYYRLAQRLKQLDRARHENSTWTDDQLRAAFEYLELRRQQQQHHQEEEQ